MKLQNQTVMISLAILFAIALILTVTLICLSASSKEKPPSSLEKTNTASPETSSLTPLTEPPAVTVFLPTETTAPEITTESMSGLRFARNGNGTCTLISIGTCRDAFVVIPEYSSAGDRVTAVADGALMGTARLTAIQIPKSVTEIGYLAFANCPNLMYLSVSEENPVYCDLEGVLYSKDCRTLIQYPTQRAGDSYFLASSVTRISDMAFYNTAYLKTVRYEGTPEQWDTILIGAKNYALTAASVEFFSAREIS